MLVHLGFRYVRRHLPDSLALTLRLPNLLHTNNNEWPPGKHSCDASGRQQGNYDTSMLHVCSEVGLFPLQ